MDIINGKINGKRIKWKINKNNLLNIIIIILMSIYHTDGIRINNSNIYYTDNGCTTHPHNLYLELLAETGIFGFLFFIFFLLNLILKTFQKNKFSHDKRKTFLNFSIKKEEQGKHKFRFSACKRQKFERTRNLL